jgi:hypothetical protein
MVDPNYSEGGYLDFDAEDWNQVYAQVSCIWGSDATQPQWLSQGSYYQLYDNVGHGTITGGAMSMFLGSYKSILPQMTTIPSPLALTGTCGAVY